MLLATFCIFAIMAEYTRGEKRILFINIWEFYLEQIIWLGLKNQYLVLNNK